MAAFRAATYYVLTGVVYKINIYIKKIFLNYRLPKICICPVDGAVQCTGV